LSSGEVIFMVVLIAVAILVTVLKNKVPAWLGFVLMLAESVVAIVGGAVTRQVQSHFSGRDWPLWAPSSPESPAPRAALRQTTPWEAWRTTLDLCRG
jgi:hypothetical protein